MNIRVKLEESERLKLSKFAQLSKESKGRKQKEEKCDIRTEYQRDRDRILHSKAFRRLKHKTQVFIAPEGDHFRTRLTHTLEVSQIARTLGKSLRLNEDLIEAIALGHDLGHTPFGHTGEKVLNSLNPRGFKHNEQSIRIVDFLESKNGRIGLNLTMEVKEGIIMHSDSKISKTLEGQVVKIADRIAYINHDIDDAIRAGIIEKEDLPKKSLDILGDTYGSRVDTIVKDIINTSSNKNYIGMSDIIEKETNRLRDFMFDQVYLNKKAKSEEDKAIYVIEELYKYYLKNIEKLPVEYRKSYLGDDSEIEDRVCDYIAGMTDRYALSLFNDIFVPKAWGKF